METVASRVIELARLAFEHEEYADHCQPYEARQDDALLAADFLRFEARVLYEMCQAPDRDDDAERWEAQQAAWEDDLKAERRNEAALDPYAPANAIWFEPASDICQECLDPTCNGCPTPDRD